MMGMGQWDIFLIFNPLNAPSTLSLPHNVHYWHSGCLGGFKDSNRGRSLEAKPLLLLLLFFPLKIKPK